MTLFEGNVPQERQSEREGEKTKKKRKEQTKRASSMPNDMETAGNRGPQVEFLSSVLPVLWMCITVFAWFTPSLMDCRVWSRVIAFGGAHILTNKNSCNTKVVFNRFDRDSYEITITWLILAKTTGHNIPHRALNPGHHGKPGMLPFMNSVPT